MLRVYEMALKTWSDWLEVHVNRNKTQLFFVSMSPTHQKYDSSLCFYIFIIKIQTYITLIWSKISVLSEHRSCSKKQQVESKSYRIHN